MQHVTEFPIMKLNIELKPSYPSHEPPILKLNGFYKRFEGPLMELLSIERFSFD